MRKSFFKKLSLGMALALVLGTTAHAGVAQAAETWTLKKNSAILYLNEDNVKKTPNNYDFNFKNKPDGWKEDYSFAWSIEDEEVATVAKGGVVTAVSVGETVVSCEVTDKETEEVVAVVTADVTVKANAAEVVINNAGDYGVDYGWFIPTGTTIDLNRTMWDENGNSTTKRGVYVTDYTRWLATDMEGNVVAEDVVVINQAKGEFTFNVAGDYYLWCETYQSAKNSDTTAYDYFAVTVEDEKAEIVATQTTVTDFEFRFGNAMAKADFNENEFINEHLNVVFEKEGNDKNVLPVKSAKPTYSEDGTVVDYVTVTMWDNFVDGKVYTVEYKADEVNSEEIVAETTFVASVGKVEEIKVAIKNPLKSKEEIDNVVYVTDTFIVDQNFELKFYDANGINVTSLYLTKSNDVYYLLTDNSQLVVEAIGAEEDLWLVNVDANAFKITAYESAQGKTFTLRATYSEYNDEKGTFDVVAVGDKVFTVEKTPKLSAAADNKAVVQQTNIPDYKADRTGMTLVAANDDNLWVAISATNDLGVKIANDSYNLRFYSSDPQIAAVDEVTGYLTPYKPGYVRINVYYADPNAAEDVAAQYVTSINVQVGADRVASVLNVKDSSFGNMTANVTIPDKNGNVYMTDIVESVRFVLQVKDNYGQVVTDTTFEVEGLEYCTIGDYNKDLGGFPVYFYNYDRDIVNFITNADNVKKASVNVVSTFALANGNGAEKKLTVTLKKPSDLEVVRYSVDVADVKLNNANSNTAATVKVYGLNKGGLKVANITNFNDIEMDIVTYINKLNKNEISAATGSSLVYTITKNNKVVDANGSFRADAATGAVITYKTGEVLAASGSTINVVATYEADGMNVTYTADAGAYTITLYEVSKTSGKYTYKSLASKVFNIVDNQTQLSATPEKIVTETYLTLGDDFGKKLVWTYDQDVRNAVLECFKLTIGDIKTEVVEAYDNIAFQVRINGNKMYVKSIKVFKSVAEGEYVALEKQVNLTITVGK